MPRPRLLLLPLLLLPAALAVPAAAQDAPADRIAEATTAAPAAISAQATILDWPAEEGGEMRTLREGSNGWTCLPDLPVTEGSDPMCLDDQWLRFMQAVMSRTDPDVERVGVGYMLAPGGAWGSNTDPFATAETADNQWGFDPPHMMIVVPDVAALEGLPTTRDAGGPWVMFPGTPYAHIMIPVEDPPAD